MLRPGGEKEKKKGQKTKVAASMKGGIDRLKANDDPA